MEGVGPSWNPHQRPTEGGVGVGVIGVVRTRAAAVECSSIGIEGACRTRCGRIRRVEVRGSRAQVPQPDR